MSRCASYRRIAAPARGLDCDIVFDCEDWAERSLAALERYPLLQPFHSVREPAPGDPEESCAKTAACCISAGRTSW